MTVFSIARVELLRSLRNRTYLFFLFLLPFLIILLVGVTFYAEDDDAIAVAVSRPTGDAAANALVERLGEDLDVRAYDDLEEARRALRRDRVAAAVAVPDGYGAAARTGEPVEVALSTRAGSGLGSAVRVALDAAVSEQAAVFGAARVAEDLVGADRAAALDRARALAREEGVEVRSRVVGEVDDEDDDPDAAGTFGFAGPQNLVLFVFVNALGGAAGLVETRRLGVWRRMVATPNRIGVLLGGEGLGRLALAVLQSLVIVVVGGLAFGIEWGDPLAAAALVTAFALVSSGAGLLVGSLAANVQQATSLAPAVGIALGMLGGCLWPFDIVPPAVRTVGHLVPHAWASTAGPAWSCATRASGASPSSWPSWSPSAPCSPPPGPWSCAAASARPRSE